MPTEPLSWATNVLLILLHACHAPYPFDLKVATRNAIAGNPKQALANHKSIGAILQFANNASRCRLVGGHRDLGLVASVDQASELRVRQRDTASRLAAAEVEAALSRVAAATQAADVQRVHLLHRLAEATLKLATSHHQSRRNVALVKLNLQKSASLLVAVDATSFGAGAAAAATAAAAAAATARTGAAAAAATAVAIGRLVTELDTANAFLVRVPQGVLLARRRRRYGVGDEVVCLLKACNLLLEPGVLLE